MIGSYKIFVNDLDRTSELEGLLKQIVYRDNMGLVSDTCDFTFNDSQMVAIDLLPDGAKVELELSDNSGGVLKTGALFVDTGDGSIGSSIETTIGTNSQPMSVPNLRQFTSFSKRRTKLKTILTDVLKKSNLSLNYRFNEGPGRPWDVNLKNVVIRNETIGTIVSRYADDFGCMVKIYDGSLIFANKQSFDLDPVLVTLVPSENWVENFKWSLNERQYSEFDFSYYNPRSGKYTKDKKNKKSILITESETVRRITEMVADTNAARAIALSIDGQRQALVSFDTEGGPQWIAGGVIDIKDLKKLSGKYIMTSVQHTVDTEWKVAVSAENIF